MNRARRRVIVHHHIFKNAGVSFDHLLHESFGARWATLEAATPAMSSAPTSWKRFSWRTLSSWRCRRIKLGS